MRPIHPKILLAILTALVLAAEARAYCYQEFFGCETYLIYDPVNNYVSGYSYTYDYTYAGFWVGVSGEFDTPQHTYYQQEIDAYGFVAIGIGPNWSGNGMYMANAMHYVNASAQGWSSDMVTAYHPVPTGEVNQSGGWDGYGHGIFIVTLTGANTTWEGELVQEIDPGGGGPDTCWFEESPYGPFEAVTAPGQPVPISGGNQYQDTIGYGNTRITYYQNLGKAPCGTQFQQVMQMMRTYDWESYFTNTIEATVDVGSASATRQGVIIRSN